MSVQGLLAIGLCCVLAVSLLHSAALFRLLTSKLRGVSLKRECGTTQTLSWQLPKTSKRIHTWYVRFKARHSLNELIQ